MFVLIVGCGRVGSAIANSMLGEGHEVSVLDEDPEAIALLDRGQSESWEERGGRYTVGTALELDALLAAGIQEADAFVASTDGDNTNLVIAQIAKRRFQVDRVVVRVLDPARARWYAEQGLQTVCPTQTAIELLEAAVRGQIRFEGVSGIVARCNNPRNLQHFELLGVKPVISATDLILRLIEHEVPKYGLVHLLDLPEERLEIIELEVAEGSEAAGRAVKDLGLPDGSLVISILRDGGGFVPAGDSIVQAGDEVLVVLDVGIEPRVTERFTNRSSAAA